MSMRLRPKHLLCFWLFGFVFSLVIQSVFQAWFAEATIWGRNVGWQTEIAIWNTGMSLALLGLLRQPEKTQAAILPGLFVLSILFGANHLQAALRQPGHVGNWLGAALNFAGVFMVVAYYLTNSKRTP